jgi:hypothetical protein
MLTWTSTSMPRRQGRRPTLLHCRLKIARGACCHKAKIADACTHALSSRLNVAINRYFSLHAWSAAMARGMMHGLMGDEVVVGP